VPRPGLVPLAAALVLLCGCQGGTTAAANSGPTTAAISGPTTAAISGPSTAAISGPSTATPAPAVSQRVVVLDPGHNGGNSAHPAQINRPVPDGRGGSKPCNTTGTATDAGYPEHAFAWDVTQRVQTLLTARGIKVVLTRSSDTGVGPCVDERGSAGERAGADAVVSIHADGAAPAGRGFHVAYSNPPLNDAQRVPAIALATALRNALDGAGFPRSSYLGRDGLAPRPDLAGLNHSTRPAALVESANMRNPAEAALVSSPEGRARYAAAIAEGVLAFLDAR
jgi:N-acetylmuramoyl-L-alanine amidase